MKVKTVALSDIQLVDELYPRQKVDNIHVLRLMDAYRADPSSFPPLRCDPSLRLIDGRHRYEALKRLKVPEATVVIEPVSSDLEFFVKAVEANITHGKPFAPYDLTTIAVRLLDEFNYSPEATAALLRMPLQNFENWLKRRVATSSVGLYRVSLKAPFVDYGGTTIPAEVETLNRYSRGIRLFHALEEIRRQLMDEKVRQSFVELLADKRDYCQIVQTFVTVLAKLIEEAHTLQKKQRRKKQRAPR